MKVDEYGELIGATPGTDFLPFQLACLIAEIAGVVDVVVEVGDSDPPTSTAPFSIALDEIAALDSADPPGGRTTVTIP